MKMRQRSGKLLGSALAFVLAVCLSVQYVHATSATHSLGNGAGGADYCTVWNYYYNQNTRFGTAVSNHYLTYNGSKHDAFCLNPYLNYGNSYSEGYYSQGYGADYNRAIKYIAMYNDGYPQGYTDQQRKMAAQLAIFDTSQMGTDYAPPTKRYHWYEIMFSGGVYGNALNALWSAESNYSMPATSASLGVPQNITNVHLTYNSSSGRYEATVNAGTNAQYYSWSGYASRNGNYVTFSVPAGDIAYWTGSYGGNPAYTSDLIYGSGNLTRIADPTVWTAGSDEQPLLTVENTYVNPVNSIRYSLYVDGIDEGRPGGGGGLYGGRIATDAAVAGGGSGYVGAGSNVISGSTTAGNAVSAPVPDGSNDGYARINLID